MSEIYYKQTQLEAMASKKAAAEFQLEKEMKRLQEAQVEAEMSRVSRRASSSWEEDIDMKTLNFAEWSKTSRFWGCQGHTISVAISNCSNPAAFLFESCRIYGTRQPYFTMKGSSAGGHSQTMLALPICDDYNIVSSLCRHELVPPQTTRVIKHGEWVVGNAMQVMLRLNQRHFVYILRPTLPSAWNFQMIQQAMLASTLPSPMLTANTKSKTRNEELVASLLRKGAVLCISWLEVSAVASASSSWTKLTINTTKR
ncbi:unnamed protein product [Camellia sinensis]